MEMRPLLGVRIVSLAGNVPGPVAAARLHRMGAEVTKVEHPAGDPLAQVAPAWYAELVRGQFVLPLDLKSPADRRHLDLLLAESDLLLTATRPAGLERLGLGWSELRRAFPHLSQVAITGHPAPDGNRAGHDLTFQASSGLLTPPALPRTLLADLAAAERAVSAALGLILGLARGQPAGHAQVALSDAAEELAVPLRYGLTTPGGPLGGALDVYGLYRARDGWIAVAALEPHFRSRLAAELDVPELERETLQRAFLARDAREWEAWADERDLPIAAVREQGSPEC